MPSRDHVAGQANVQHGQTVLAVSVVNPVLRGELDARGTLDRAEGNLVHALATLDRCREKGLVANVFLVVDQPYATVDPAQPLINPHGRRVSSRIERVRHRELREDRARSQHAGLATELVAEDGLSHRGHWLMGCHGDLAAPVQATIKLPQVSLVGLSRHDVGRTRKDLPVPVLDSQAR